MSRVLLVVENCPVPRDRRVWGEALALRDAGFDVTVISPMDEVRHRAATEVLDGVTIRRFRVAHSDGSTLGHLKEYLSAAFGLARLLVAERRGVSVVHVANPPDFLLLLALPLKLRGARLVFDQHDLFPELFETRFGRRGAVHLLARLLERSAYRIADLVITANDSYRAIAMDRGRVPPDRVVTVRNAPDPELFVPGPGDPSLRRAKPLLAVYVGVIGRQDGAEEALRALAVLKHELGRTDLHTAFVGDGDHLETCRALAAELDIEDIVEFAGWQEPDAVVRWMSSADIALAPDPPSPLNDRSTMVKLVEYLTMGLPTVSFDLPESIVTAGEAAAFVPGGDIAAFANAVATLMDDPGERDRLAQAARERATGSLSWKTSRSILADAYRELLGRLPKDATG